jgi:hypothetical protein
MFSTEGPRPFALIHSAIRDEIEQAKSLHASPDFTIYDLFGDRLSDLELGAPDYPTCYIQHYTVYVSDTMEAFRCCVLAYNDRGKITGGDLKTRSFAEFWSSDERKKDFADFRANGCKICQYNSKNQAMNYLLGPEPPHLEFP